MTKCNAKSAIEVLAIDLAKNSFQLHGIDVQGKKVFGKKMTKQKLKEFVVKLPTCEIAMEACGSAHYWARLFQSFGHTVKLIAPQFVKPYVKSNKNDAADAAAIAEHHNGLICVLFRSKVLNNKTIKVYTESEAKLSRIVPLWFAKSGAYYLSMGSTFRLVSLRLESDSR